MTNTVTRRRFVQQTAFTILGAGSARTYAANAKIDIGIVGVANRAKANLNGVAGENIVSLCDVDSNFLALEAGRETQALHLLLGGLGGGLLQRFLEIRLGRCIGAGVVVVVGQLGADLRVQDEVDAPLDAAGDPLVAIEGFQRLLIDPLLAPCRGEISGGSEQMNIERTISGNDAKLADFSTDSLLGMNPLAFGEYQ